MATTRSSISRLLRAAATHRTTNTTLLQSHSSNLRYFSLTSHRVALQKPRSPRSIWPYALTFGCIAATGLTVFYRVQEKTVVEGFRGSVNEEKEQRFEGSYPNMFRKGHSVVVELVSRPKEDESKDDNVRVKGSGKRSWEFYLSATEVLTKPEEITSAMERNKKIIEEKVKVIKEEEQKVAKEKLEVAEEKLKVAVEEQEAAVDWSPASSKAISKSAADLLKSKSKAMSPEMAFKMYGPLKKKLVTLPGLPILLREGDSVFVIWFEKPITNNIKEDKFYEIKKDKSTVRAIRLTMEDGDKLYHNSLEVLAKHDEKYMQ